MTKKELYSWIARYTVENAKYMRYINSNDNYDCYNNYYADIDIDDLRTAFSIPNSEMIISFLRVKSLLGGAYYRGVVFTDKKAYYKNLFDDLDSYPYSQNSNFYPGAFAFYSERVCEIMNDVYIQIEKYEAEQYRIAKRNKNIKNIVTGGGIVGGIATILAGISTAAEISRQESKVLEENDINDIIEGLSNLLK